MTNIFEKQFKKNIPKRDFMHKIRIGLTLIWLINLCCSIASVDKNRIIVHLFCSICWGFCWFLSAFCWFLSAREYKQKVLDYTDNFNKEKQANDMENAFNFGSYPQSTKVSVLKLKKD